MIQNRFHKEQLRYRNTPAGDEALNGNVSGDGAGSDGFEGFAGGFGGRTMDSPGGKGGGLDGLGGESPTKPLEDEGKAEGKDGSGGGGGGDGGDGNPGEQPGRGAATAMPASPGAQSAAGSAVKDGDDMLLDGDGGGVAGKGGKDGGEGGEEKGSDATIVPLFRFQCEGTEGRTVTSQAWNKVNGDILGVGYGDFTFAQSATSNAAAVAAAATDSGEGNKQTSSEVNNSSSSSNILGVEEKEEGGAGATGSRGGMVLCWSMRNPLFPERRIQTTSGVTSLDFSTLLPNLLAVGMYDGTVAIYNLKNDQGDVGVPLLDSSQVRRLGGVGG